VSPSTSTPQDAYKIRGHWHCTICAGWSSTTGEPTSLFPEPEVKPPHASFGFINQPWANQALCAQTDHPEAFFPDKGGSTREAKAVCAACFVQAECLDWALTTNERFGIWGGLSERERRKLQHPDTERTAS
jgi:WhiB family redox-sensing transcriptional regulator